MKLSENYIDACNYRLISEDMNMGKRLVAIWSVNAKRVRSYVVAIGEDLKDACVNWENTRNNNDDLFDAYKKSKYCVKSIKESYYDYMDNYEKFIESLSGREMYEIMRDGQYNEIVYNLEGIVELWLQKQSEEVLYQLYTDYLDYEEISYEYNQEFKLNDIIEDCDFIDYLISRFDDDDTMQSIIDDLGIND